MGIFDGLAQNTARSIKNTASQFTSNLSGQLQSAANSVVSEALNAALGGVSFAGGSGGIINGKQSLTSELSYAKTMVQTALKIHYAQGWQFVVEAEGLSDFHMFVKDVTYGSGTIETEPKIIGAIQFNKPTHISAGTVTLTVRDTQDGMVAKWFDAYKNRVVNRDGTINLSPFYTLSIRVYRITFDGQKVIDYDGKVFATERGSTTRAYDQAGDFFSYPLTFTSFSSADTSITGIAGSVVSSAAGSALNRASGTLSNIIKY